MLIRIRVSMTTKLSIILDQISSATSAFISSLEKIYEKNDITLTINKNHVYNMVMTIVAPVILKPDYTLINSPHFKNQNRQMKRKIKQQRREARRIAQETRLLKKKQRIKKRQEQFSSSQTPPEKLKREQNANMAAFSRQEEKLLAEWVRNQHQAGRKIYRADIQDAAKSLSRRSEFQASRGWLYRFTHRNNLGIFIEDHLKRKNKNKKEKRSSDSQSLCQSSYHHSYQDLGHNSRIMQMPSNPHLQF